MTAVRVAGFAGVWWALTPGEPASWIVGVPAIVAATWAAGALVPREARRPTLGGFLRFVPFFLRNSFQGGVDVAWRALSPSLPIEPRIVRHPLRLPAGTARTFLVNTVSLLPGTLSADIDGPTLVLHVLARPESSAQGVAQLEVAVAALFGVTLLGEGAAR